LDQYPAEGAVMRCTKIHDLIYDDALQTTQIYGWCPDDDPLLVRAYAVCYEREIFHGAHRDDFCTDYLCNGWGRVNRWSERLQRGW
jgi:hypothetical protein